MVRKPLIYICAPYRIPDPVSNTHDAIRTAFVIRDLLGAVPLTPHLSLFEDFHTSKTPEYWLDATMDQMRCCDAVYRFNMKFSAGADAEEAEAKRLGIPVFKTLPKLATWVQQWKVEHGIPDGGSNQAGADDSQGIEDAERR